MLSFYRSFNKYGSFQPKSSQVNTFRRNPSNNTTSTVSSRKRSYSFSEGHSKSISVPPSKRWKRSSGKEKFHLGGNIRDPLNLNRYERALFMIMTLYVLFFLSCI